MLHHFQFKLINLLPRNTSQLCVVLIFIVEVINPLNSNHQRTNQQPTLDFILPVYAVIVDHERLLTFLVSINQDQSHHICGI